MIEYSQYLCPMTVSLRNEQGEPVNAICKEAVHLIYRGYIPLDSFHKDMMQPSCETFVYAEWKVECANGHVLAVSIDEDGNGNAAPFSWDQLP